MDITMDGNNTPFPTQLPPNNLLLETKNFFNSHCLSNSNDINSTKEAYVADGIHNDEDGNSFKDDYNKLDDLNDIVANSLACIWKIRIRHKSMFIWI